MPHTQYHKDLRKHMIPFRYVAGSTPSMCERVGISLTNVKYVAIFWY